MPHETVKETKNTVADPDPLVIVIVIATEIVTGIVTDVVVQDHVLVQEIAIGTNDAIVHVQETDADQVSEIDTNIAIIAIINKDDSLLQRLFNFFSGSRDRKDRRRSRSRSSRDRDRDRSSRDKRSQDFSPEIPTNE